MRDIKNIGLALGGGAVLGAAHIGVIRAIEESNIPVKYVSGTSIGAFVAALYSFGIHWEEMQEMALEMDWLDISGFTLSQYGLLSNKKIGRLLSNKLGDVQFKDAKIPLVIIATDIANGEKVSLSEGSVAEAVMASTCLPGIFEPVKKGDQLLIDGGIMENVPVLALEEKGADFVIGVDLYARHKFTRPGNMLEVLVNTINLSVKNTSKLQTKKADLLIMPELSAFNKYDTSQAPDLIKKGYLESKEIIKKILLEKGM